MNATALAPSATSQPSIPARPPPRHNRHDIFRNPQVQTASWRRTRRPQGSPWQVQNKRLQIATEMPPEVANAPPTKERREPPEPRRPSAHPPLCSAAGARTMIWSAPSLPSPPPPGTFAGADAGARTMMATAPVVPALGGGHATLIRPGRCRPAWEARRRTPPRRRC